MRLRETELSRESRVGRREYTRARGARTHTHTQMRSSPVPTIAQCCQRLGALRAPLAALGYGGERSVRGDVGEVYQLARIHSPCSESLIQRRKRSFTSKISHRELKKENFSFSSIALIHLECFSRKRNSNQKEE